MNERDEIDALRAERDKWRDRAWGQLDARAGAEHRAESLQRQVSEYREALEPFVRGLDHPWCETLDDKIAPYVTRQEAAKARSVFTASSTPEQGTPRTRGAT